MDKKRPGERFSRPVFPKNPVLFPPVRPRVYSGPPPAGKGRPPLPDHPEEVLEEEEPLALPTKRDICIKGNHSPVETMNDLYHEGAQR